jgi:hypothetical protein
MAIADRLNDLWGGVIDNVMLDIDHHAAEFAIRVTDVGRVTRYRLRFSGVVDFHFVDERLMGDWNYAELTEIECKLQSDESIVTEIGMWGVARLTVHSLGIDLTEADSTANGAPNE